MTHSSPPPRLRFFFGHQSVGADMVQGLATLAATLPVPQIHETQRPVDHAADWLLAHARLGRNFDPVSKIDALIQLLDSGALARTDTVMLKFCYVDVATQEQAAALHERYTSGMQHIAQSHPRVRVAHCTIPLRQLPSGPYALARRLLGHRHPEYGRNQAREWFNERLRTSCSDGQPLFDLALIESTHADARRCLCRQGPDLVPSLAPEFTDDGGHLNQHGRTIVATAFLRFLHTLESR